MQTDLRDQHQKQLRELADSLEGNTLRLLIKKKTISNLFRYDGRKELSGRVVDLSGFNQPLFFDPKEKTLEVQGLTTYSQIVDFVLPKGFLPLITPELKHITVGGATVGIGIETNSFRYGFVHNGLLEADVLLPTGEILTCTATNEYADLFYGLANSYGTLGYILRAKIQLRPALPFVHLHTKEFKDTSSYLTSMKEAADTSTNDYVEGLAYSGDRMYLTTSREVEVADKITSIYGGTVFYKEVSQSGDLWLSTKDYLFRYDPEWFWNMPDSKLVDLFRRLAPPSLRNSGFYAKYSSKKLPFVAGEDPAYEKLIQDWEVPWKHAGSLLSFVLDSVDLAGKPLMAAPLQVPSAAPNYPMKPNELYLNLGSYSFARKQAGKPEYYYTKLIDEYCFDHDGIKMLYSTTFLDPEEFDQIYGGAGYAKLKHKYDPQGLSPTLYEKAVRAR